MSGRVVQFTPVPTNSSGSSSVGNSTNVFPRVIAAEATEDDDILDSFTFPRPDFSPTPHAQKRMRTVNDMEAHEASLSFSMYMDMKKDNEVLKEMLRKEQEEKQALQTAYNKIKGAYDELEAELCKSAKPISVDIKDGVRSHYNSLPPSSQYILDKPLKSSENQIVLRSLQDYVKNNFSCENVNNRDLLKYLERQYYTKKAGMAAGEKVDPIEEYIKKRRAAKVTRRSAKTRARKAIFEQYKDQNVYDKYPNCEYLLQQQYMSEEEDMYSTETIAKVEGVLLEQDPDRRTPFTEKEMMSVLCKTSVDYFEVRVPKYRSSVYTEFLKLLDDQIASEKAKKQRTGGSNIQLLPRVQRRYSLPIPDFIQKNDITEESIAWAFSEMEFNETKDY
ncbi:hypothetical protein G6F49_000957 [Rhizopus delemar]|nr:hypothetical protein G6F49_000957 [Rhizopus delemar]KAG1595012.1 hypothetical protein G6F48_000969 [Rhizopus delemar]